MFKLTESFRLEKFCKIKQTQGLIVIHRAYYIFTFTLRCISIIAVLLIQTENGNPFN